MSDADLIAQLRQELEDDPDPPIMDVIFDPFDPIEIDMILHEIDFAVDKTMKPYLKKYRDPLDNPALFDEFVLQHKIKLWGVVHSAATEAQERIHGLGYNVEMRDPFAESDQDE